MAANSSQRAYGKITSAPRGSKGRFVLNVISNIVSLGITSLVALWLTPYLVKHLGVAAYGLIPLGTTLVSYLQLVTLSINSAVGRFLTISVEQERYQDANRVFNSSLWSIAILSIALAGPAMWVSFRASGIANVPAGYETQAHWLFACIVLMLLLSEVATPFQVATFCRNRFDINNAISITSLAFRIGVIVLLFNIGVPRLWHVGIGLVLGAMVTLVAAVATFRHLLPMITIDIRSFDMSVLRSLLRMGGWIVVNQIGALLYTSIDLIVVNRLFGAYDAGRYAAVLQWSILLRSLAGVVAATFGPTVVAYHAAGDRDGLIVYARRAIRFVGFTMALPIGLVCGLSRPLLQVWLGADFTHLWPILTLLTVHLAVNLGIMPLFGVQVAEGRVRLPGIVTCVMGAGNLGLALLLAGPAGWGMYGVAAAGAIMLTAKNLVFTPIYGARILGQRWSVFYGEVIRTICMTAVVTVAGLIASTALHINSLVSLAIVSLAISLVFCTLTYTVFLDAEERQILRGTVFAKLAR